MNLSATEAARKIDQLPQHLRHYALGTPAINDQTVTQGHAEVCALIGHMSYTVDGVEQGVCPRCGDVTSPDGPSTAPQPVPAVVPEYDLGRVPTVTPAHYLVREYGQGHERNGVAVAHCDDPAAHAAAWTSLESGTGFGGFGQYARSADAIAALRAHTAAH